jgi:thiol:disulfide interchange protein
MTSRFHLQKGSDKGYLVLRVELDPDFYIYSLTQTGEISPTQIKVAPSRQFRLTGKFNPDRPATIIEKDPIFNHRIEKHKGSIQFFAPIQVAPDVDVSKLTANLSIQGQVCKENGFCMPVMGHKVAGRFAGYFERQAQSQDSSQSYVGPAKLRR